MERESTRQQKVGKQLQKDLAEIIRERGMSAFGGALISVTSVRISPDLAVAKVHLSIFPSAKAPEVIKLIEAAAKSIRGELGRRVSKQLRIVPEMVYYIDDSLDYVDKIDELLKK
ncbi:MAG: 30S ribosome-binding factor RbfA [Rikenellaceae bacterium]